MRFRTTLTLTAAVALLSPAGTSQAFDRPVGGGLAALPLLAGEAVVHAEAAAGQGFRIIRTPLAGGPQETLATSRETSTSNEVLTRLVASEKAFAYRVTEQGETGGSTSTIVTRFADRQRRDLGECPPGSAFALSGARFVSVGGCGLSTLDVEASDPARVVTRQPPASPRVAGRYVAYLTGSGSRPDIVVRDLEEGDREVHRIAGASVPGRFVSYSLGPDGKVAIVSRSQARVSGRLRRVHRVRWTGPEGGALRRVRLPESRELTVKLVGDRLAFRRKALRGSASEVGVISLESRRPRILSRRAVSAPDFDGARVAYASETSRGLRIFVRDVR